MCSPQTKAWAQILSIHEFCHEHHSPIPSRRLWLPCALQHKQGPWLAVQSSSESELFNKNTKQMGRRRFIFPDLQGMQVGFFWLVGNARPSFIRTSALSWPTVPTAAFLPYTAYQDFYSQNYLKIFFQGGLVPVKGMESDRLHSEN